MRSKPIVTVIAAVLLVGTITMPALAAASGDHVDGRASDQVDAQMGEQVDECMNADAGPGEGGPPGFVGDLVPNVISEVIGSLPVPNFVKSLFGAPTC